MSNPSTVVIGGVRIDINDLKLSNRSSNVASVKMVNVTLIVLVGFFAGLRLFVRRLIVRKIFADDVLIVVAAAFTIALALVCLLATKSGLGTHVWMLPLTSTSDKVKTCILYLYVCQILYTCAIAVTKLAIISSYLRFMQYQGFRFIMYVTAVVIVGLWFTGMFVTMFQCSRISSAWDLTDPTRKCINYVDYLYASSAIIVATDIILCVLPCPYLWKLKIPRMQRVILCLLFSGGAGACVASIIRIANIHNIGSVDVTYQSVLCLNLSVIECSLGIICVSIPPLRPLAVALFPKTLRGNRSSTAMHSYNLAKRLRDQTTTDRMSDVNEQNRLSFDLTVQAMSASILDT